MEEAVSSVNVMAMGTTVTQRLEVSLYVQACYFNLNRIISFLLYFDELCSLQSINLQNDLLQSLSAVCKNTEPKDTNTDGQCKGERMSNVV